jgi:hypothetical protein
MLLLDYWPLKRTESLAIRIRENVPLFCLSLASGVITFLVGCLNATYRWYVHW